MLTKRHKFYILIAALTGSLIISSNPAVATTINPAAELQNLLGDPKAFVASIEEKPFYVIAQVTATMTSIVVVKYYIQAIFPR